MTFPNPSRIAVASAAGLALAALTGIGPAQYQKFLEDSEVEIKQLMSW